MYRYLTPLWFPAQACSPQSPTSATRDGVFEARGWSGSATPPSHAPAPGACPPCRVPVTANSSGLSSRELAVSHHVTRLTPSLKLRRRGRCGRPRSRLRAAAVGVSRVDDSWPLPQIAQHPSHYECRVLLSQTISIGPQIPAGDSHPKAYSVPGQWILQYLPGPRWDLQQGAAHHRPTSRHVVSL